MKQIGLLNTSVMTGNQGDYIIVDSVKRHLATILDNAYVVEMPTHAPLFRRGQFGFRPYRNSQYTMLRDCEMSFLAGTNILSTSMRHRCNLWKVQPYDRNVIRNVVTVGVGTGFGVGRVDRYTTDLYRSLFSVNYYHSVRDDRTRRLMESVGFKAINTGCATMWSLTPDVCGEIPEVKSDTAVVTLTDYMKDPARDKILLDTVLSHYDEPSFWIQGAGDYKYLNELGYAGRFSLINPNLASYDQYLDTTVCDFVGTRLHAGIRAMQKGRRSIIIGVDNRVRDMVVTYDLVHLDRSRIDELGSVISSVFATDVRIRVDAISCFKKQFV